MSKKILITGILLILVLSGVFFLFKKEKKSTQAIQCCRECLQGATRDVRGMDISGSDCLFYEKSNLVDAQGNPEVVLSPSCVEYFKKSPATVQTCRTLAPSE